MDNRKEARKNRLIMLLPLILPGAFITSALGVGFFVFLIPLVIFIVIVAMLAKKLNRTNAIAYSIVQSPFLILLIVMLYVNSPFGLEIYFIPSMVFIPNMIIGTLYFRFVKNKRWLVNTIVLLLTLGVTLFMFPV
jgi:hypothetical protein